MLKKLFTFFAALMLSVGLFADATPVVSPVAELPRPYSPTQIRNGSFDEEPFMIFRYNDKFYTQDSPSRETDNLGGEIADSIIFNGVGQGWNTTSNKIGNSSFFEYVTEYTAYGIYIEYNSIIPASDKFVEMNCEQAAMLYQDLNTYGGDIIRWTLKHGHRQYADPVQPMRVEIGAPMSDINGNIINAHGYDSNIQPEINPASLAKYTYDKVTDSNDGTSTLGFGNADELAPLRLDENVGNQGYGWHVAKGVYIVPEGQRVTRFGFISEASNPVEGNLLDDITFSTLIGNLNAVADNENNVTVTGYWGDDDNTKHLMVKIGNSGTPLGVDMTSVLNKNFSFVVPAATIGQATTVTIYHEDYPQACRVVTISHEALYTVTMLTGTNGFGITDRVDYKYNATATAEAFATLPYEFKRWEDGNGNVLSTDNPYSFTIQKNTTLLPIFATPANKHVVTVISDGNGHVSGLPLFNLYDAGATATLNAVPNVGFEFRQWEDGNGVILSTDNPFTFTVTQDTTVKPIFKVEKRSFTIANGVTAQMGKLDKPLPWAKTITKPGLAYRSATGHDGQDSRDTLVITPEDGVSYRLTFDYAVSSEGGYDLMSVWVNETLIADHISGEDSGSYDSGEILVTEPTTIVMSYGKDGSYASGEDRGYIYNIVVTSDAPDPVYIRDVTNGSWGTLCLPWESIALEGGIFYDVLGTKDPTLGVALVELDATDQLTAGKPYVFKATSEQIKVTYDPTTEVEAPVDAGNHIIGSFTGCTVPQDMYIIYNNMLYKTADATSTIGANRAYFDADNMGIYSPVSAPARVVFIGGNTTPTDNAAVRADKNANGKYIMNGRLVIIREGRRYNAHGMKID